MTQTARITVEDHKDARIIRFQDRRLYDDQVSREVGEQLLAAMPRSGKTPMIIDFSGVESLSSSMLVKLLVLQRQIDSRKIPMRLCELSATVHNVFQTTNLDRLFRIDRDLNTALDAVRLADAS